MEESDTQPPPGWNQAKPEHIPAPSVWPAAMALATTFLFWSLVTSPVIAIIGAILFVVSITGWIQEIRHDRSET